MKKTYFLALVLLALLMAGCYTVREDAAESFDVDVMSFNIRYGTTRDGENHWDNRKGQVIDVIRQYSPDVLGLQEALRFQMDEIRKSLPQYGETGVGRDGGTEGEYSAILYRLDRFDVYESGTFWLSDTPEVPSTHWGNRIRRICSWARLLDRQSGLAFYIYNTHLDHRSQPSREKSVRLIVDFIQKRTHPDPFVLTGDFNAGEDNPAIEYLKGKGKMADTFRILHPEAEVVGTFNGFKGRSNGPKVDCIFVSPSVTTLHASIVRTEKEGRYPSDHFPVTANLQF